MTTPSPRHSRINLADPGHLVAAIPHLLGFHPEDSLVVLGVDEQDSTVRVALRVDLPHHDDHEIVAEYLAHPLRTQRIDSVALVVVTAPGPDQHPLHSALIRTCERAFGASRIAVPIRVWTAATTAGAPWRCYDAFDCAGQVPDPASSPLAAATVAVGAVTYDRREDIAATLLPVADELLARRAELLASTAPAAPAVAAGRRRLRLVQSAIDRAAAGELPETDEDIVALATALGDHSVRDAVLDIPRDPDRAAAAERLWTALVRATPAPQRAEPAICLAYAAYARGDGVLAGIAADYALAADPGHRLAELLRGALYAAIPPERIRMAAEHAATRARRRLT